MRLRAPSIVLGIVLALGLGATACAPLRAKAGPAPTATRPAPRLVVLVVIDQLPSWAFEAHAPLARLGLRQLLDQGVVFPRVRFPYAATLTAPGHAALVTGAAPAQSGIVGNRQLDRQRDVLVPVTLDPRAPVLGDAAAGGVSPHALRVATVGDALSAQGGRVVSLSVKDRAAVMMGGKRPTLALWYDANTGTMTSSRYYVSALPRWAATLPPASHWLPYRWEALDRDLLRRWGGEDDAPDEPADHPLGRVFPHLLAAGPAANALVERTPVADELLLEAALRAVDALARGPRRRTADLLAISFSTHDKVGHAWGQESWEALDIFLRLDVLLGRLLARLDRRYGAGRYSVLLTSDHGATRGRGGRGPQRIMPAAIIEAAGKAAEARLGAGPWIAAAEVPFIYLGKAARALPAAERAALVDGIAEGLAALPGVAFALPSASVRGDCEARAPAAATQCRAVHPEVAGEVLFGTEDHAFVSDDRQQTTSHGSLNDDDALVPVVIMGPSLAPGRRPAEVSALRVASTLAELLGIQQAIGGQRSLFR
ncbi:MAG: alkaline phosphatase family protein [Proteobacteria bacterium]|nr:alkaline phosphatase family protein [Pseudomonadota bacterium]